jgi:hypothetical protein
MKPGTRILLLLGSASIFLLNGCATKALWNESNFYEPASPPNLRLSVAPTRRDVLVEYDEFSERTDRVRRRAYFLDANARRLEKQRKPHFVNPARYRDLQTILLAVEPSPGISDQLHATWSRDTLAIHSGGQVTSHLLPVYFDPVTRTKQVLLTPPAVIVDATLLSAMWAFILWAESGFFYY